MSAALLRLLPIGPHVWERLGQAMYQAGWLHCAKASFEQALRGSAHKANVLACLSGVQCDLRQYEFAEASCRRALELEPQSAVALNNLGNSLKLQERFSEARECYQRAVELEPRLLAALLNLGKLAEDLGLPHEAEPWYRRALQMAPQSAEVNFDLAVFLLKAGSWAQGWQSFEARFHRSARSMLAGQPPCQGMRRWQPGQALAGKRILVRAEQGLGDMIQFVRFVPLLHRMGARVFLSVHRPLMSLLGTVDGLEQLCVLGREASLPQMDYWIPALSLGGSLGIDEKSIPADVPYLCVDPRLKRKWADRLQRHGAARRIGIAWCGNPVHKNDRYRSMSTEALVTLARAIARVDAVFFGLGTAPLPEMARRSVLPLGPQRDFAELAALVENLDLVITVDSAFAHLAGALARPVWLMLPLNSDWRWLRDRSDSPWYPTMRLFRQRRLGDWSEVIEQVACEVNDFAAASKAA